MSLTEKDKQGIALIVSVVAILVIIFGIKLYIGKPEKPDQDGCVGKVKTGTVIVLDHSEKLTQQTIAEISARALSHVSKSEVNERVIVFDISDHSKRELLPLFNRCKPPKDGNRVYQDTRGLGKVFNRDFLLPLQNVLKSAPGDSRESPIAQALIDISLSQYLRNSRNSLLVFSDMLENTPKFSMYGCGDPDQSVAIFRQSRRGAQERPKFANTEIFINIIPRSNVSKSTLKCRDRLWEWFLGDNVGEQSRVEIDYLPGE